MIKRGISSIVTAVLLIFIIVIMVMLLWAGIHPAVNKQLFVTNLDSGVKIQRGMYTNYDANDNILEIQIKTYGTTKVDYIKFIINFEDGTSLNLGDYDYKEDSSGIDSFEAPGLNQKKIYRFEIIDTNLQNRFKNSNSLTATAISGYDLNGKIYYSNSEIKIKILSNDKESSEYIGLELIQLTTCATGDTESCGKGVCALEEKVCSNEGIWSTCSVTPQEEICDDSLGADEDCDGLSNCCDPDCHDRSSCIEVCGDGLDNNCNNMADEDCTCTSGDTRNCGSGLGICSGANQQCNSGIWGDCSISPQEEICDDSFGADEDCDGKTNCADLDCEATTFCMSENCEYYIDDCESLNNPGVYCLSENIETSLQDCITISNDNITLDCKGKNITGNGGYGGSGIKVSGLYSNPHSQIKVMNCFINNFYHGLYAYYVSDSFNNFTDNDISCADISGSYGIYLQNADNSFNNFLGNEIHDCYYGGIYSLSVNNSFNNFNNNNIYDNGDGNSISYGIYLQNADNSFNNFLNNEIHENNNGGIYLQNVNNSFINFSSNYIYDNKNDSIYLLRANNVFNNFSESLIKNNYNGLYAEQVTNSFNYFTGNDISLNNYKGIYLKQVNNSFNINFSDNSIHGSLNNGIYGYFVNFSFAGGNNNLVFSNLQSGFFCNGCSYNNITGFIFRDNRNFNLEIQNNNCPGQNTFFNNYFYEMYSWTFSGTGDKDTCHNNYCRTSPPEQIPPEYNLCLDLVCI